MTDEPKYNKPTLQHVTFKSGCRVEEHGAVLKDLFHTEYFKVNVVKDADTVELCGSLKVSFGSKFQKYFDLLSGVITGYFQGSPKSLKLRRKKVYRQQCIRWKSAFVWGFTG